MDKVITDEKLIDEILTRGVSEVIDRENLKKRLLGGEKLRIKLGIDPTSPNLHIGRAVTLLKMKDLQDLGHQVVLIIGDTTGVIGDTSDKESERPMLNKKTIVENLKSYKEQAGKILDMDKVEFHYNSEWLAKLGYNEIGEHADQFSLAEFNARENIKKRLEAGTRISLREMLYPLMQGYDSVAIEADVELGGNDQRFNLLAGRELQKHFKQKSQDILMVNLIEGLDGRKMSSSWGNTINLTDTPNNMFGKTMKLQDELIPKYFIHCTRIPLEEITEMENNLKSEKINPRDAKLDLAFEIVRIYHGENEAKKAKDYFIKTFSKKETPENVLEVKVDEEIKITEFMVLAGLAKSKSDARRKIEQGGVDLEGKKTLEVIMADRPLNKDDDGKIVKVGKKDFVKIKF